MSKTMTDDYPQRVHDALHQLSNARKARLMREHAPAYGLVTSTLSGLIKPDGLTEEGVVKLSEFGAAVGVDREPAPAVEGKAKK